MLHIFWLRGKDQNAEWSLMPACQMVVGGFTTMAVMRVMTKS